MLDNEEQFPIYSMLRILKEITEQMQGKEIVHGTWISERGWKELTVLWCESL